MPWKNGGGSTTEIAVVPPEADLETFGWRVSMADVTADGPFSVFPGIDRTLAVLSGRGIELTIDDHRAVTLTAASAPFAFAADLPTRGVLVDGPIRDLNVMTRRGQFRHAVTPLRLESLTRLDSTTATTVVLFCQSGRAELLGAGGRWPLAAGDAAVVEQAERDDWQILPDTSCKLFQIDITTSGA